MQLALLALNIAWGKFTTDSNGWLWGPSFIIVFEGRVMDCKSAHTIESRQPIGLFTRMVLRKKNECCNIKILNCLLKSRLIPTCVLWQVDWHSGQWVPLPDVDDHSSTLSHPVSSPDCTYPQPQTATSDAQNLFHFSVDHSKCNTT